MSKCIFCKKEDQGVICKHCLTKGSTKTGKVIKKGGEFAFKVAPAVLAVIPIVITKGKFKTKS